MLAVSRTAAPDTADANAFPPLPNACNVRHELSALRGACVSCPPE